MQVKCFYNMVLSDLKENRSDRSERKKRSQRKSLCSLR